MTTFRNAIPDFQLANQIYAGASVSFYTVNGSGVSTGVLATLYANPIGATTTSNPQVLDADGKFLAPVYIDVDVIAVAVGPNVASHSTGIVSAPGSTTNTFTANDLAGIITGAEIAVSATFPVPITVGGKTLNCSSGGFYQVQFGNPATYQTQHRNRVWNTQTDARVDVYLNGVFGVRLYPGDSCHVENKAGASWGIPDKPPRYKATIILYVAPDGTSGASDTTKDGLAPARPFATLQHAADLIASDLDANGAAITIQMTAPGTYSVGSGLFMAYPVVGKTQIHINGDNSSLDNAHNYVIQCNAGGQCVANRDLSTFTIHGVRLKTIGNGSTAASSTNSCNIDLDTVVIDRFPLGNEFVTGTGSQINFLSKCRWLSSGSVDCVAVLYATDSSQINITAFAMEIPSAMDFVCFAEAINCGVINGGCTFTGVGAGAGSTGQQWIVDAAGGVVGVTAGWVPPGTGHTTISPGWQR